MSQPNVLLICTDHWPGPLMGVAGHQHIMTPTMNTLADAGVHFTQAYSATPTCIPARRALMTGTTAQTHGDRVFNEYLEMDPALPTMPQTFRDAGYQAYAVGKLHVYPQRSRIGFDEVILCEEGRRHLDGIRDDFERFLTREGYGGQELTHGMGNNNYSTRPWHLPEHCHPTNWTTREMCETIQRRDPTRPAFWYCSYITPHPPITPLAEYLDIYQHAGIDDPVVADWAADFDALPYAIKKYGEKDMPNASQIKLARMGFYAQCTYIDHQIRLLIGTLREEGVLDDTIIMITADHGDMLGHHNLWGKPPMYEWSAKIPMILVPLPNDQTVQPRTKDDRLAELRDVMPTLLDMCDIPIPETVEGHSLVTGTRREHLYCEHFEGPDALRMIRADQYKLIWYPIGNRVQLFDVVSDPMELHDLAANPHAAEIRSRLEKLMVDHLYGDDLAWVTDGRLVGEPDRPYPAPVHRDLFGQRGWRA